MVVWVRTCEYVVVYGNSPAKVDIGHYQGHSRISNNFYNLFIWFYNLILVFFGIC